MFIFGVCRMSMCLLSVRGKGGALFLLATRYDRSTAAGAPRMKLLIYTYL